MRRHFKVTLTDGWAFVIVIKDTIARLVAVSFVATCASSPEFFCRQAALLGNVTASEPVGRSQKHH
jgi:hypothetical protein